jgi:hypothetical protein
MYRSLCLLPALIAFPAAPAFAQMGIETMADSEPPCLAEDGEFAASDCMIRMTGATNDSTVTYTYQGDFSEYLTGTGQRIYLAPDDVAMFNPQRGGWVDIPPSARTMIASQMRGGGMMPDNAGEVPDFSAQMPRALTERFSFEEARAEIEAIGSGEVIEPAPCPDGGDDCARIVPPPQSQSGALIYDEHRRLIVMNDGMPTREMRFEYGHWALAAPADWTP